MKGKSSFFGKRIICNSTEKKLNIFGKIQDKKSNNENLIKDKMLKICNARFVVTARNYFHTRAV